MRRIAPAAVAAAVVIGVVGLSAAFRGETDRDRLRGSWVRVAMERDGKPVPAGEMKKARMTFHDDRYAITAYSDAGAVEGSYRASYELEAGATPGRIVLHTKRAGAAARGIYRLDGDRLTLCVGPDRPPAGFATRPGSRETLSIYERETSKP